MIKKLTALTLSFLMVLTCTPVDALASAASAQLTQSFEHFFSDSLNAQERALIWANRDAEDEDGANPNAQAKHFEQQENRKKPEPQEDLETYFADNELLSALGTSDDFDKHQDELAFYILNSDWRTHKGMSQGDKAITLGLVKLAQAFLGWMNLGVLDTIESSIIDKTNNQTGGLANESSAIAASVFESASSENHDVDQLYVKIQNNAFNVVLLSRVDFEKMIKKYPEVAFLFEDLYTFFRWRYEMRSRDEKYRLNENNIYHVMNSATRINSFLGWWELANVAKWFMANTIAEENPDDGLFPFTMKTFEEERNNLKVDYRPSARDARYFGRVWNCMQRYAAKNRHMETLLPDQEAKGVGTVLSPIRGFKPSVRRSVYKALDPLSDKEVFDSLKAVRYQYVTMRARSEIIWRNFVATQVEPRITEKSAPAWKEKLTDPTPIITDDDIKTIKDVLALFGAPVPPFENSAEPQTTEENFDEPEQVDNDPEENGNEGGSEGENQQEIADQVTQGLKQKFGK